MPERTNKTPKNVPGRYYVDDTCIDCGLCPETAPGTFRRDDVNGVSFAWKQPVTAEEIALAEQAAEGCPTDSVGNDGGA
jgi:ferredoxin